MSIADLSKEQLQELIAHLEQYLAGRGQLDSLEMLLSRTQTSLDAYLDGGEPPAEDDPVLTALQSALQDRRRALEANAAQVQQATTQVDAVLARLLAPVIAAVPEDDGDDTRSAVADIVDAVMDGDERAAAPAAAEPEAPGAADPPIEVNEGAPETPGRNAAGAHGRDMDTAPGAPAAPVETRPAEQDERADSAPAGAGIWDALIESEANPQTGRG